MTKATEEKLSALHGAVATVLTDQLTETIEVLDEETNTTKTIYAASPAVMAQAIKFLKDNDITASIEDDSNISGLADMLKEKREKRGLRLVAGEVE
ncbi:MAG: hypothetical protein GY889_12185 [Proteobacteria bacterium]|nr:hypothetical protein [Pseudomonadota bacterium]